MGRHSADVDDACSRTALLALEQLAQGVEVEFPRAWLLRIAHNVCMDLHRVRRTRRWVDLEAVEPIETPVVEGWPGGPAQVPSPERQFLADESFRQSGRLVSKLPDRLRTVMEPLAFRDLDYREIARDLGITEASVRKRVQQARELLREWKVAPPEGRPAAGRPARGAPKKPGGARNHPVALQFLPTLSSALGRRLFLPLVVGSDGPRSGRIGRLESYIRAHPGGWKKRLELARVLCAAGRLEDAVPHYQFVRQKRPYPRVHWTELAALLEGLGRGDEAAALLGEGAEKVGRASDRRHLEALQKARLGRWQECCAALRGAVAGNPEDPGHWRRLGLALLAVGSHDEAAEAFSQTLALLPGDYLAEAFLGSAPMVYRPGAPHGLLLIEIVDPPEG